MLGDIVRVGPRNSPEYCIDLSEAPQRGCSVVAHRQVGEEVIAIKVLSAHVLVMLWAQDAPEEIYHLERERVQIHRRATQPAASKGQKLREVPVGLCCWLPISLLYFGGSGWTRTNDQGIMSPLL